MFYADDGFYKNQTMDAMKENKDDKTSVKPVKEMKGRLWEKALFFLRLLTVPDESENTNTENH